MVLQWSVQSETTNVFLPFPLGQKELRVILLPKVPLPNSKSDSSFYPRSIVVTVHVLEDAAPKQPKKKKTLSRCAE